MEPPSITTMLQSRRHRRHQTHHSTPTDNATTEDFRTILARVVEHLRSTIGAPTADPPAPHLTHFKDVVARVMDTNQPPKPSPPPLPHFCLYFLFTAVTDASLRLNDTALDTQHGWRRAVGVVKRLHSTVNTLDHACERCEPAFRAICMALLEGLWMDEGAVEAAGDEGTRNGVMLGVLAKVRAELTAVHTSGAADFMGSRLKAQLGALISVMGGWAYDVPADDGGVIVRGPAAKQPPPPMDTRNPQPSTRNPQPSKQAAMIKPPPTDTRKVPQPPSHPSSKKPPNLTTILAALVAALDRLTSHIDTSATEVVFDAVSCFADAVRDAMRSLQGADLAVQAHWDHAVGMARLLEDTAHDLGHWAQPLHRPLAETFFAVRGGMRLGGGELCCEGGARSAVVVAMLGGVGRKLRALMDGREGFYGYMGREAGAEMVAVVGMLVSLVVG